MTEAEMRALRAVAAGKVFRVYDAKGNILRGPKGVSAATLWRLDRKHLICDDQAGSGRSYRQVPTKDGLALLQPGPKP
jgi:hypothetical protein